MTQSFIESRTDGDLYFVSINRVEKRNAISPDMLVEIGEAVARADENPQLRAVIVHGEGSVFSSGIDVTALGQAGVGPGSGNPARRLRRVAERLQHALHRIESTELPIIGALHGHVIGMGLELALAFDLRVGAEGLKISLPESRMGLVADVGGTTRLSRLVGPSRAKDMLMTARAVEAAEALQWGLINRVVPEGKHLQGAIELARQIAANAPLPVGMGKLIIDQGSGSSMHTQMAIERWAQSQLITTGDVTEAAAAFLQKRPAKFQGN